MRVQRRRRRPAARLARVEREIVAKQAQLQTLCDSYDKHKRDSDKAEVAQQLALSELTERVKEQSDRPPPSRPQFKPADAGDGSDEESEAPDGADGTGGCNAVPKHNVWGRPGFRPPPGENCSLSVASSVKRGHNTGIGLLALGRPAIALTDVAATDVDEATQAANNKSRTAGTSSTAAIAAQIVYDAKLAASALTSKAPPAARPAARSAGDADMEGQGP